MPADRASDPPLVLSLFPGVGLLDMAFEEGFSVVRGPDLLWGGDIRRFHVPAGRFDGVIGGPPCQAFSQLMNIVRANGHEARHGNLIPEFERIVVEAQPMWFVMENVPGAPTPSVVGYTTVATLIRDVWVGGDTSRLRRFSFGTRGGERLCVEQLALHAQDTLPAIAGDARTHPVKLGGSGKRKYSLPKSGGGTALSIGEMLERQGFPATLLDEAPFTVSAKRKVVANGVPLPMGRAIAKAVKRAMYPDMAVA